MANNFWQTDEYGNTVFMPVDYTSAPGGEWATEELTGEDSVKTMLGDDLWEQYGGYFEQYKPGQEYYEKEIMQRGGAGVDIGQLGRAWDFASGQLGEDWYGTTGIAEGEEGYFAGAKAGLEREYGEAGTTWGIQKSELERQRLRLGDQITEAQTMWGLQKDELLRKGKGAQTLWGKQRTGLEEDWRYKKGALGRSIQSGLRQSQTAQETAVSNIGFATVGTREFERLQREIREGYGRDVTEGEKVLARNLGVGDEELTQTLEGLGYAINESGDLIETGTGQIGLGDEAVTQAISAYQATQAGLGWSAEGGWAGGAYAAGEDALVKEQARIQGLIDSGQITYDQAIATGVFNVGEGTTDIGQTLQGDVWSTRNAWREQQRSTLHALLGAGIFGENPTIPENTPGGTGGSGGGFPYSTNIGEYMYTDAGGGDDSFNWYGDDFGWGEDYDYEDWWEFESDYS